MYTRRELGKAALAAWPAVHLLRGSPSFAQRRPNSRVRGVMIGMNVPYNFGGRSAPIDEIIEKCVQLDVSGVELRSQPVEAALGLAEDLVAAAAPPRRGTAPDPTQDAGRQRAAEEIRKWRVAVPMDRVRAVRKRFDEAGIAIDILKVDNIFGMPDDVVDYEFELAKALGARAISTEIAHDGPRRLGTFADKHRVMVGYHGHTETGPAQWEEAFRHAKYNGANVDIGHFVAGTKTSPVPFLTQHHQRITHVHVKDKTLANANVPFGTGDTPIKEVLQLIRDNTWPIQATIEFEYPIPSGSDRMAELRRCVEYCRAALA